MIILCTSYGHTLLQCQKIHEATSNETLAFYILHTVMLYIKGPFGNTYCAYMAILFVKTISYLFTILCHLDVAEGMWPIGGPSGRVFMGFRSIKDKHCLLNRYFTEWMIF